MFIMQRQVKSHENSVSVLPMYDLTNNMICLAHLQYTHRLYPIIVNPLNRNLLVTMRLLLRQFYSLPIIISSQ